MMQLPNVLKAFTAFVDGIGTAGICDEVNLPKVSIKTDEHRDGGMDAPVEIDMGLDKMEASLTFSEYKPFLMGVIGTEKSLTIRGSIEGPDGKLRVVAKMRGLWKEADPGAWKAGDKSSLKLTCAVKVYKLEIAGQSVYDINIPLGIRSINGEDQNLVRRANLGI